MTTKLDPDLIDSGNLGTLAGLTLAEGDVLYATGANTLVRLAKGTAGQVLTMNAGATAPSWETPTTSAAPSGQVGWFAMNAAPSGWLKCDGSAVLVASYGLLTTAIYCGDGDNATALFGYRATTNVNPSSNRSTTGDYIILPDLRGEFIRGWDDSRGVDSGRAFGTAQADELESHNHTSATFAVGSGGSATVLQSNAAGAGVVQNTGGSETRPRNVALLACIKT